MERDCKRPRRILCYTLIEKKDYFVLCSYNIDICLEAKMLFKRKRDEVSVAQINEIATIDEVNDLEIVEITDIMLT